jgi:hypothetical protein
MNKVAYSPNRMPWISGMSVGTILEIVWQDLLVMKERPPGRSRSIGGHARLACSSIFSENFSFTAATPYTQA